MSSIEKLYSKFTSFFDASVDVTVGGGSPEDGANLAIQVRMLGALLARSSEDNGGGVYVDVVLLGEAVGGWDCGCACRNDLDPNPIPCRAGAGRGVLDGGPGSALLG
jgi:hypothetical protein